MNMSSESLYRPLQQIVSLSTLNRSDLLFSTTEIRHVFS